MARFDNGWVKVYRKLTSPESDIGSNGYRLAIFTTLLAWANREESTVQWNGKPRKILRGQVVIGVRNFADHLGFSKDTVFRQISYLCLRDTICKEVATEGTLITIPKYEEYQDVPKEVRQDCDTDATLAGRDSGRQPNASEPPNGEVKNIRSKTVYTQEFESLWEKMPEGIKQKAFKAFQKLKATEGLNTALDNYLSDCKASNRFKMHLSSFIGSDRTTHPWIEFVSPRAVSAARQNTSSLVDVVISAVSKHSAGLHLSGEQWEAHKRKIEKSVGPDAWALISRFGGWQKIHESAANPIGLRMRLADLNKRAA